MRKRLVWGIALCILARALPALAVPSYTINPIPIPADVHGDWAYLNDHGLAAGHTLVEGEYRAAVLDTRTGAITDLHVLLDAKRSIARGLNNSGQVIGDWIGENDVCHAFSWKPDSGMVDLGDFGGPYTYAGGINEAGEIVGCAMDAAFTGVYAVHWNARQGMRHLRGLAGIRSSASDINNHGQVAGDYNPMEDRQAFIWDKAHGMVDLGSMGGQYDATLGINDYGQVIGQSFTADGYWCGWIWNASTGMRMLPTLSGNFAAPRCINDAGQIVGDTEKMPGWPIPALWESGGGIADINDLVGSSQWEIAGVSSINNKGWMMARAWSREDDLLHWCVLRPVGISFVMDIMPGSRENKIKLGAKQDIPVALIADEDFDPAAVDLSSISLAGAPVAGEHGKLQAKMQDVNNDKRKDLVIGIDASRISLTPGAEPITVTLTGRTKNGTPITGKDLVMVAARK